MSSLEPDTAPGLSSWLHWSQTRRQDSLHDFTGDTQTRRQDCLHGFTRARDGTRTVFMASLEPYTARGLSSWLHWSQTRRLDCLHSFTVARHGARTVFMTLLETPRHGARTVFMASLETPRHGARTVFMASLRQPDTAPGLSSWLH